MCSLHSTLFSTLVSNVFFISISHVEMNQQGGQWLPGHLPRCDARAEKQENQLPLEELSSSQQIKGENNTQAGPAASTQLCSTCQLTDCGQVISSSWHHNHFHLSHVRICKSMKVVKNRSILHTSAFLFWAICWSCCSYPDQLTCLTVHESSTYKHIMSACASRHTV